MDDTGNVFFELGFSAGEAENLKIRSDLMDELRRYIETTQLSQKEAAKLFNVTQPRISNLVRGRIDLFSIDTLVNMAACAGLTVTLSVKSSASHTSARNEYTQHVKEKGDDLSPADHPLSQVSPSLRQRPYRA